MLETSQTFSFVFSFRKGRIIVSKASTYHGWLIKWIPLKRAGKQSWSPSIISFSTFGLRFEDCRNEKSVQSTTTTNPFNWKCKGGYQNLHQYYLTVMKTKSKFYLVLFFLNKLFQCQKQCSIHSNQWIAAMIPMSCEDDKYTAPLPKAEKLTKYDFKNFCCHYNVSLWSSLQI